jgi:hypothetical protein
VLELKIFLSVENPWIFRQNWVSRQTIPVSPFLLSQSFGIFAIDFSKEQGDNTGTDTLKYFVTEYIRLASKRS